MNEESVIRARIDADLKSAFESACKANDRTTSQILRDMIKAYVRENAQPELIPARKRK